MKRPEHFAAPTMPARSQIATPGETLLPLPAVLARVGLSRSNVYALIGAGKFPAPVKIGAASRWPSSRVDTWITAAISESGNAA